MSRIPALAGAPIKASFVLRLLLTGWAGDPSLAIAQSPGTFTATGDMTTGRVAPTATLLYDGRVLIAGGYVVLSSGLASTELYDPSTGTFTATGDMTAPRSSHTATLLPTGKVLIAGGSAGYSEPGGDAVLANAELYDPSSGTFNATGNMTVPRQSHTATLLSNGDVLITGGGSGSNGGTAELYDPSTGTFRATGNMTAGRFCHRASLLPNGKVLIIRGGGCASLDAGVAEEYDPDTGTFSLTGGDDTLFAASASLLNSGKVLVTLEFFDCESEVKKAALYDPASGTFHATGNMAGGRCLQVGTALSDGTVLISGNWSCADSTSAELYDPASGTFTPTGGMIGGRYLHTTTLLQDGRVLVAGGVGVATAPCQAFAPATAELYNPPSVAPAPTLLSLAGDGRGQGAILHAETHQVVTASNPAVAGEALEIYGTGLIVGSVIPPQVAIGGQMAAVFFFGKAPGFTGLNQINVRLPSGVMPGSAVPVRLIYLGRPSNEVTIGVE